MKKIITTVSAILLFIVQVGIVVGLNTLDELSRKKAGVNHHLMARKGYYEHWILTDKNEGIMQIAAVVLIVITALVLVRMIMKKKWKTDRWCLVCLTCSAVICGVVFWELGSADFQAKLFYPYALLGTFVIYLLELIKIPLVRKSATK